jgi:undecaprenyl diphosphate synthase
MSLKSKIDPARVPRHVAVIMDGNGRWAQKMGKERVFGHENGVVPIRKTVEGALEIGVEYLTFFAFSSENWNRPKEEVETLMHLLVKAIKQETPELHKNGVKLIAIGNLDSLPLNCRKELDEALAITSRNEKLKVIVALSYSSKWEIVEAAKALARKAQNGEIEPDNVDCQLFEQHLQTTSIPDPDLLIRTSGELRISNFLLWQIAYSELVFTEVLWPDFNKDEFFKAVLEYQKRERRFGRVV